MLNNSPETKCFRIALDAMGGDFAPINEIQGAIEAYKAYKALDSQTQIEIVFVGNETQIRSALAQFDYSDFKFSIVHAEEVVTMDDDPTDVLKNKKNSSLYKALELHSNGYADAFVSAGNTGAVLSTGTVLLGRIKGVSRPTIGSFFPTQGGQPVLVLDVGANVDSKPRFIYEFAVMGSIYTTQMLGVENPRVGLLNYGEEPTKGTETVKQAYKMIKESNLNFIGNVEGRDILLGSADVIVCDGFVGNVVLKFAESFLGFMKSLFKSFASKNILNLAIMAIFKPVIKKIFKNLDYQEYGGVPLLGVKGVVIIGHGKSTPKALKNMILRAVDIINKDLNKKIENALNPIQISETNSK